jgi:hypothetical protein
MEEPVTIRIPLGRDSIVSFDDAVKVGRRWLMSLTSAIGEARYFDAWLASVQLRVALDRAEQIAALMLTEPRQLANLRLGDLRSSAAPLLALAPAPSRREICQLRVSRVAWRDQTLAQLEYDWAQSLPPRVPWFEGAGRAFFQARLRVQDGCNDLSQALECGYSLDMELAARSLVSASCVLSAAFTFLVEHRSEDEVQLRASRYEVGLFRDAIARLIERCQEHGSPATENPRLRDVLHDCGSAAVLALATASGAVAASHGTVVARDQESRAAG